MPKCFKCGGMIISFNQMQHVYVHGHGKVPWCNQCYDEEMSKYNIAMTPSNKQYIVNNDAMDEKLKDKRW